MTARPSARARPQYPHGNGESPPAKTRAELAAERDEQVRKLLRHPGVPTWLYSVEVANALGWTGTAGVNRALTCMHRLEQAGLLESRCEPSPISGIGRRYFRALEVVA
ncbi:MAG: hypothetical protein GWN84_20810 [Gammaproteobacteria bacterium]|nr:hypothetical protein [Gammaproteobacteria bacterium]NIR85202.1 hypothetical protein [Gammaproteobacteria bacterium]NIU06252.1 hypothetical protein [Gammaproteobacteria bacterium]NIX87525.1 hypothetical protein [Gammaproteobacteria bacterium]